MINLKIIVDNLSHTANLGTALEKLVNIELKFSTCVLLACQVSGFVSNLYVSCLLIFDVCTKLELKKIEKKLFSLESLPTVLALNDILFV